MKSSGVSKEDEIHFGTALFKEKERHHPKEDVNSTFKRLEAWKVLRVLSNFFAASDAPPSGSRGAITLSPIQEVTVDGSKRERGKSERPIGYNG